MKVPSYCRHKASGMAYVTIYGQEKYLGKYGSEESIKRYERAIAEHLAGLPRPDVATIVELCADYFDHARRYYVKDGLPTGEVGNVRVVIRKLRRLYGDLDVHQFRPRHLRALMQAWQDDGVCRGTINRYAGLVKRMFRWGVEHEIVLPETYTAIQTVGGLRKGRTDARESEPVEPIDDATVELTLPHCCPTVQDMIRLQQLTGCRPGELCRLKSFEVDRSKSPWEFRPARHKTEHHGGKRVIFIGPQAQQILAKYLFQQKPFGYDTRSYRRHIHRASDAAKIPRWSPGRLRHTAATTIRARYGLEAAQVILGHSTANTTEIYAERNAELARRVASEVG